MPKLFWQPMLQERTVEPQVPRGLQQPPNLEPAHVFPPLREPQRPLVLTLDVAVGAVDVAVVAVPPEAAGDDAFTVELVSVDAPVLGPVAELEDVTEEVPQVPNSELHPVPQ